MSSVIPIVEKIKLYRLIDTYTISGEVKKPAAVVTLGSTIF